MPSNFKIIELLSKYLQLRETSKERKEIYDWYDQLLNADSKLTEKITDLSRLRVKRRIMKEIELPLERNIYKRLWPAFGAVALMLIVVGVYLSSTKRTPVDIAVLNKIGPQLTDTKIILPGGKVILISTIPVGTETFLNKNVTIVKDSTGLLHYLSKSTASGQVQDFALQTPASSQCRIQLTDGTKVFVNANSKLIFPSAFISGDRHVQLQGEAYFEVKKTQQHSKFFVITKQQTITVLGTKFDVKATDELEQVRTTLLEGSVKIIPKNKAFDPVIIKPNQQALLKKGGLSLFKVDAVAASRWKEGYFLFDGENTAETLQEISHWYGVEIEVSDKIAAIKYTGKIPQDISLGQLIELLKFSGVDLKVYHEPNRKYKLIVQ